LREPTAEGYAALAELLQAQETAGLFLDVPYEDRPGWNLIDRDPLLQMVWEDGGATRASQGDAEFFELSAAQSPEMIALAELTKPGPFNRRTHEMGTYLGIRREGKLVAMTGERLKVPGFTEVSAVCTHPDYLGKGYARILMTEVMRRIGERGETPFLHVRENNLRAIELYRRLGFSKRRRVYLAVLRKESV
jgi:predicted GNAT family acetyltransferase